MQSIPRKRARIFWLTTAFLIAALAQIEAANGQQEVTFAQNGEARLRVFVEGDGPAIVLLPGQGRGPRDFDDLAKYLVSANYRVIRPEPRGFGESVGPVEGVTLHDNARDVAVAIEKTSAASAIIVGWAYGNRVARMLAADRPELVRGVVLVAAGGKFPPKPEVVTQLGALQDKNLSLEKRAEAARNVLYGPKSNITVEDMRLDESSTATIKTQSQSIPIEMWWDGGKAPMLVLQGLHDVIAPPENGRSLQQDHPERVTLVEFEDLGHAMARERPDLVGDAIVSWARKVN